MPQLSDLPIELLDRIISFIYPTPTQKAEDLEDNRPHIPSGLASLSQTNKFFQEITEEHLYKSIHILTHQAPAFAAAISNNPKCKAYVKEFYVDKTNSDSDTSACTYAPLYSTFPNLEVLSLCSGYWHWDDDEDDENRTLWETDQDKLTSLFSQAGLSIPLEERIWTKLRSCVLDFDEMNGQGWYCTFEPAIFLVASLEELTIRGCRLTDDDDEELLTSPYRGTTALKKLVLERTYIHHTALFNFLSAPRALEQLTLDHSQGLWHHEMGDQPVTSHRPRDYMKAFKLHSHSLQSLYLNEDMCDEVYEEDVVFDFSTFPELRGVCFDNFNWCNSHDGKHVVWKEGA